MVWRMIVGLIACAAPAAAGAADPQDSVVHITAEWRVPNPIRPWLRNNGEVTGSGVVIDGNRILTNAHVLTFATRVTVKGREGGEEYEAKVVGLGPDVDLGLLTVDDPEFFESHPALPRAEKIPATQSQVSVYGFPVGGNSLSVTRGIISRVEYAPPLSAVRGLILQVDAAINPGNSGGPAVVDDQMVGVAFSRLNNADNIGYIITNREVDGFLADIEDGSYRGLGDPRLSCQTIENAALRAKLGLDRSTRGVLFTRADLPPGVETPLKPFDVITHIGETPLDNLGMIDSEGLRLPFWAEVPRLERDGRVPVTVFRAGETLKLDLPLVYDSNDLIPSLEGKPLPFFVCGPLVFAPARTESVNVYFRANPALALLGSPLELRQGDRATEDCEELVVVTAPMVPLPLTRGYDEPFGRVVASLNGTKVRSLGHFVELLRDCKDEYLVLEFADKVAETLVFKREEFLAATPEAMDEVGATRQGSEDTLAIWNKKGEEKAEEHGEGTR
jgi:S1-C subfamily serine protease